MKGYVVITSKFLSIIKIKEEDFRFFQLVGPAGDPCPSWPQEPAAATGFTKAYEAQVCYATANEEIQIAVGDMRN
ncbi:MAG: hypothetical protein WA667_26245 [Candidatus Nitrosopolaris sp.]